MDTTLRIALLVNMGGITGGLLYWTSLYLASTSADEPASRVFPHKFIFCLAQMFMGVGGAWALLLAMLWGKRAPMGNSVEDVLQLFASCLVAGFTGSKLLPSVADQLTKQFLKDAEKRAANSAKQAKKAELTSEVYTYLEPKGSQSDHQTSDYVRQLSDEISKAPTNRKAVILLARIYDELLGETAKSIYLLEAFIAAKTMSGAVADGDVADAYWNIANYSEALYQRGERTERSLRDAAIEAISKSINILPGYKKNLLRDQDFQELKVDPQAVTRLSL